MSNGGQVYMDVFWVSFGIGLIAGSVLSGVLIILLASRSIKTTVDQLVYQKITQLEETHYQRDSLIIEGTAQKILNMIEEEVEGRNAQGH